MTNLVVQLRELEVDLLVRFEVMQAEAREIGDEDVSRQVTLGQAFEVIGRLREGRIEILTRALVLDEEHALPEQVDASAPELPAGTGDLDLLLEHRNALAVDAEHGEEAVPEALRLGALGALAFPFAREGERARLDLVPGEGHRCRTCEDYTGSMLARMLADPRGERWLVDVTGRHGEHRQYACRVFRGQPVSIEFQEQFNCHEGGALVAVDERVIARDSEAIGCGEVGPVGLPVRLDIPWPCERRLQQAGVTSAP